MAGHDARASQGSSGSEATKPFSLLVKPVSANCNLRCEYCFYRRVGGMYPGRRRMGTNVLEAMVKQLLGLRFSPTAFSWQGGEPTLAGLEFYRQAVALQSRFGFSGQVVANSLQTNGVLIDDAWAEFLAEYRFLVGLSLDGPQDLHDAYRKRGGEGTFVEVMRAAEVLRRHEVEFNILSLVTPMGAARGAELYRFFVGEGFTYLQFIPCVERTPDGRLAPYTVGAEEYGRFLSDLFDAWLADGRRASIRLFDALLERLITGESPLCVLGRRCDHYLVVEHSGDVYPCDFFVTRHWQLGNLLQTPLARLYGSEKHAEFAGLKGLLAPECQSCEWKAVCWGGCLKERQIVGDPRRVASYLCPGFRQFFGHAMGGLRRLAKELAPQVARRGDLSGSQ
jgi:uncharacterized protein